MIGPSENRAALDSWSAVTNLGHKSGLPGVHLAGALEVPERDLRSEYGKRSGMITCLVAEPQSQSDHSKIIKWLKPSAIWSCMQAQRRPSKMTLECAGY